MRARAPLSSPARSVPSIHTDPPETAYAVAPSPALLADAAVCADNHRHFGPPVYEYTLSQAIEDGYLAACEIQEGRVDIDDTGITPMQWVLRARIDRAIADGSFFGALGMSITITPDTPYTRARSTEIDVERLESFRARAPELDRTNSYFHEDLADLRTIGYPAAVVPAQLGGWSLDLAEAAASQRRLARYAPATALALTMHTYWVGIALEFEKAGDSSLRWIHQAAVAGEIIAAGGVTTLDDLRGAAALEPLGVTGVIVGRALYEGAFTLAEAQAAVGEA